VESGECSIMKGTSIYGNFPAIRSALLPSMGEATKIAPGFPQLSVSESYSLIQRVGLHFGQERGAADVGC
jgi:hypothetical protein